MSPKTAVRDRNQKVRVAKRNKLWWQRCGRRLGGTK